MTPQPEIVVVCLKAGDRYGSEYVNRLYSMVERHLTVPHRFVCLTDEGRGLMAGIHVLGLEEQGLQGWWHKLTLFKPPAGLEDSRRLFLDLDTVIVGNIDFLLDYDGPFAILRDFYGPNGYGSAIMSIAPGYGRDLWDKFVKSPEMWMANYWGDQEFIECCGVIADLWQDLYPNKIVSYKVHCQAGIPEGASIVCFHGDPKPHEVGAPWVKENWKCGFAPAEAARET